MALCHLAPLAATRSTPCHLGRWWRSTRLPCRHHRQAGGCPDPHRQGRGHQLTSLAAARSEVDGTRCWGGHNLARGGAVAISTKSTMSSTAWAIRKRESRKERRTGTRGHAILLHLHCGSGGEVAHMLLPLFLSKKKCKGSHAQEWVKGSSKKIAGAAISSLSRSPLFPALSLPDSPHVGCLRFLSNERCVTPGVSHISAIGAPTGHQISDAHP
jgi:hypothetical protein